MKRELKKHQLQAIDKALPYLDSGLSKMLLSMPNGTGKSLTIASLFLYYLQSKANIYNERILIIVDRKVLLERLKLVFQEVFEDSNIISENVASQHNNTPFFILTLQSLLKNESFKEIDIFFFKKIVYYDCERLGVGKIGSPIFALIEHFKVPLSIGIDGVTEKSSLFFGPPIFRYSLREAIEDKVLLGYRVTQIRHNKEDQELWSSVPDRTEMKESGFDYFKGNKDVLRFLAKSIIENINDGKTVVFCKNQEHAVRLSNIINEEFNNRKYSQLATVSVSNDEIQSTILKFQKFEEIKILVTVNLLVTGVDLPNVKNIVLLRNFGSEVQFHHLISNYLQPYKDKEFLHIIDFVGVESSLMGFFANELADESNFKAISIASDENLISNVTKTDVLFKDSNSFDGVLGVKDLADELSQIIIKMPYEQGRMIGIFGKWGRGKTFLFNEAWKFLEKEKNIKRVDFHAWKYQDTPAIWAYLYERFAAEYYSTAPNKWNAFLRRIRLNVLRFGWWEVIGIFTSLSLSLLAFFIPLIDKIELLWKIISALGFSFLGSMVIIFFKYKNSARELFKKYYTKKSFSDLLGIQAEVQKELKLLLKAWNQYVNNVRVILFVDDIDRCSEDKIIGIVDSLRVMLDDYDISNKLIVVTAIDERILKHVVRAKYSDLITASTRKNNMDIEINNLISEYLDKLFITGLKLGNLIEEEKDEFFNELTKDDRIDADIIPYNELLAGNNETKNFNKEQADSESIEDQYLEVENNDTFKGGFTSEKNRSEGNKSIKFQQERYLRANQAALSQINKLPLEEINLIRQKLQLLEDATPRRIRIFYYRYLIARNLLLRQYSKVERRNIWTSNLLNIFIELLIILEKNEGNQTVSSEREKIAKSVESTYIIEFLDNVEVDRADYQILICTLDTVIGY